MATTRRQNMSKNPLTGAKNDATGMSASGPIYTGRTLLLRGALRPGVARRTWLRTLNLCRVSHVDDARPYRLANRAALRNAARWRGARVGWDSPQPRATAS